MVKKIWQVLFIILLCTVIAAPVMAASADEQGGGGVRFGAYTLEKGNTTSGDLVVFGGPVTLEDDSTFDGDLTVLGELFMETGATIEGQLVVLGNAYVAGMVDGDVFVAGSVNLDESAYIDGDLSVAGELSQEDSAVVLGEIDALASMFENNWNFSFQPIPVVKPLIITPGDYQEPYWIRTLRAIARATASVVILSLVALVATSLWPQNLERVGRTIEEAPLISFGTGLLTLVAVVLAAVLLIITICLSPFALIGLIVVSLGVLMGWIALGYVLGKKVLTSLFSQPQPQTVLSAVIGTGLLTMLMAMAQVFGVLQALLMLLLIPLVAGAVLLTRFGTMPYATRGGLGGVSGVASGPPSAPQTPTPPPLPGDTADEVQTEDTSVEENVDDETVSAEESSTKVIDLEAEGLGEDELLDEKLDE